MSDQTYVVTIKAEASPGGDSESMIHNAMSNAMFALSEFVWDQCDSYKPWAITVSQNGLETADLCYQFNPEEPNEYGLIGMQRERYDALVEHVGHDDALKDARKWPTTPDEEGS